MSENSPLSTSKIFVSYRRDDSSGSAGRLYDNLKYHFGDRIFMDVDSIRAGDNFVEVIQKSVRSSAVVIAVIGKHWHSVRTKRSRRLDDPNDFVRLEIVTALENGITVIPTLVDDGRMPKRDEVPAEMVEFTKRHYLELRPESWHRDIDKLVDVLERIVGPRKKQVAVSSSAESDRNVSRTQVPAEPKPTGINVPALKSPYFPFQDSPWRKELAAKREAEEKRREAARKSLPAFYQRGGWWASILINILACVSVAFLAESLVKWVVSLFGVQPTSVSLQVAVLIVFGCVWGIAYSLVSAAFYAEDPERGPAVYYTRGLFGGWPLAYSNYELWAGFAGSFPLSMIAGWWIARGLAWVVIHLVVANYSGITYLFFGLYTLIALGFYTVIAWEER
jgi:TIR domain-containing protein